MQTVYTRQLLLQQPVLYGEVARASDGDVLRALTFCDRSLRPVSDWQVRRVGRPRHEWAKQLNEIALNAMGKSKIEEASYDDISWKRTVNEYINGKI